MNKKIFDFRLFKEGVRQTRLIGLISMISILAFTLLIFAALFLTSLPHEAAIEDGSSFYNAVHDYPFYGPACLLVCQYMICSPLMILYLFRFLNRRNASDFYHAIPHSREALHGSYFAAVQFWNLITTVTITATVLVLYGIAPYLTIETHTILPFLFNQLAAQFTISAAVLLAMSITGTTFTNLVVSLLILFLPRILLTTMAFMVGSVCKIVDVFEQFPLLDPTLNVIAGLPLGFVTMIDSNGSILRWVNDPLCGVYTFALGLIFLVLALILLHIRKSETATKSSPSRWLQAVYRIAFGTLLGLPAVAVAFTAIVHKTFDSILVWIGLLALLFLATLFYFVFELIATKRAKNLLRAIPGLFIFLALDGVILLTCFGLSYSILHFNPPTELVHSITVCESNQNYFVAKKGAIKLTDPQAIRIAVEQLEETVDLVEQGEISRHNDKLYYYNGENSYTSAIVRFHTALGTRQRYVLMTSQDYEALMESLENSPEHQKSFYEFPDANHADVSLASDFLEIYYQEDAHEIYQLYQQEAKKLLFEHWQPIALGIHEAHTGYNVANLAHINVSVEENGRHYYLYLPVDPNLFPETAKKIMEYGNADYVGHVEATKDFLTFLPDTVDFWEDGTLRVEILHPTQIVLDTFQSDQITDSLTLLEQAVPFTDPENQAIISIYGAYYDDETELDAQTKAIFAVPKSAIQNYYFY